MATLLIQLCSLTELTLKAVKIKRVRGLGDEARCLSTLCCDNCGHMPVPSLRFFRPVKATRKPKPKPVRKLSEDEIKVMRDRLLSERQAIIKGNSAFVTLGGALVCPIPCIDEICRRVNYNSVIFRTFLVCVVSLQIVVRHTLAL